MVVQRIGQAKIPGRVAVKAGLGFFEILIANRTSNRGLDW
jgi:hypothetical protein